MATHTQTCGALLATFCKDSDATLDYYVDWSRWLWEGDTLTSAALINTPPGITVVSDDVVGSLHRIWLSGGTSWETYTLTSRVTTAQGRIDDRSFAVDVVG